MLSTSHCCVQLAWDLAVGQDWPLQGVSWGRTSDQRQRLGDNGVGTLRKQPGGGLGQSCTCQVLLRMDWPAVQEPGLEVCSWHTACLFTSYSFSLSFNSDLRYSFSQFTLFL